jgi:nuclear transport factor 2 (NTF2) superfamily protein
MSTRLDAVRKARQAFLIAKATLEQRLRDEMARELWNLQTQIDIAVRYAYDSGETKANILRSLGTKNFRTVSKSLERTSNVAELVGESPYSWSDKDTVTVSYDNYGPSEYSGEASFVVKKLDDGRYLFLGLDPLWSDDYKVRNDVVAAIDGKTDGFYYEDLCQWLAQTG